MAAGATGAAAGKGTGGPAVRVAASAPLQPAPHVRETARADSLQAGAPARQADGAGDAAGRATKPHGGGAAAAHEDAPAAAGARGARAARGGARTQPGQAAAGPAGAQAPFSQALAQLRSASAAGTPLSEAAQAAEELAAGEAAGAGEAQATAEDKPDAALSGDAASAALAAVLQWLQPVGSAHTGDPRGGDAGGGPGSDTSPEGAAAALDGVAGAGSAPADALANLAAGARGPFTPGRSLPGSTTNESQGTPGEGARGPGPLAAPDAASGAQGFDALAGAIRTAAAMADAGRGGEPPARAEGDAAALPGAAGPAGGGADIAGAWRTGGGAAPQAAERTVPVPMHDRHWPQAVAGQVLVLTDQRIDSATLRLSPEHLGPVEVHIDMQAQGVNVSFGAEHAETRSALEQALPQLRAAFAGAGLTLGQATVQQHMRRESQNALPVAKGSGDPADHLEVSPAVIRAIGLVDEYA